MPIPKPTRPAKRQLVRDIVFDRLRDAIVSGELAPDEAIVEQDVEAWANASRTPVREAIDKLAAVRLIVVLPQRGTHVAPLDLDRAAQSFSVLGEVLSSALRVCTGVLSPKQATLVADGLRSAMNASDLMATGGAFDSIVAVCGNPRLRQLWNDLAPHVQRTWIARPDLVPSLDGFDRSAVADLVEANDERAVAALRSWFLTVDPLAPTEGAH